MPRIGILPRLRVPELIEFYMVASMELRVESSLGVGGVAWAVGSSDESSSSPVSADVRKKSTYTLPDLRLVINTLSSDIFMAVAIDVLKLS